LTLPADRAVSFIKILKQWKLKFTLANDAVSEFHERFVTKGEKYESNAQAPEITQLDNHALKDLSGFAEAISVRLNPTGDLHRNAHSM
jgi:hypothetical protein